MATKGSAPVLSNLLMNDNRGMLYLLICLEMDENRIRSGKGKEIKRGSIAPNCSEKKKGGEEEENEKEREGPINNIS
jgi:hypothetical protein